jgi:hypothetical protein
VASQVSPGGLLQTSAGAWVGFGVMPDRTLWWHKAALLSHGGGGVCVGGGGACRTQQQQLVPPWFMCGHTKAQSHAGANDAHCGCSICIIIHSLVQ